MACSRGVMECSRGVPGVFQVLQTITLNIKYNGLELQAKKQYQVCRPELNSGNNQLIKVRL